MSALGPRDESAEEASEGPATSGDDASSGATAASKNGGEGGSRWARFAGIALAIGLFVSLSLIPNPLHDVPGQGRRPAYAAAVAGAMALLWLFESIPIAWTACLPLVAFPLFGVFGKGFWGDARQAATPFADAYIFLFIGGMVIGAAMEEQNLHRRIALHVLRAVGARPSRLVLGVLLATGMISMWISNTATAVMMTPIALALVRTIEDGERKKLPHFGCALLLGVAYASNVGGIGTKIGTATNSIFCGFVANKMQIDLGFLRYVAFGVPFVLLFLPVVWLVLWRVARRDTIAGDRGREVIDEELRAMGRLRGAERLVAIGFAGAATLWILGDLIRPLVTPILSELIGAPAQGKHYEAGVALLAAAALLGLRAVTWRGLRRVPFSTLLLLGGSFAMASGIEGSGLGAWMAERFRAMADLPFVAQVGLTAAGTIVLSAVASNTATMNIALNVLPRSLPVLAAANIGASCDFMLPAGTPPNAIVFGSGVVKLPTMMRVGLALDIAAMFVITIYVLVYGRFVLPG